jgi:dipeptidyl aminopeptidase/acylaminoacyl peptidase
MTMAIQTLPKIWSSSATGQKSRWGVRLAPIAFVILASWIALAGCAATLTDVAAVSRSGRYEVTLPGSGITLGGILFQPAVIDQPTPAIIVLHGWAESGVWGAPRVEGTARRLSEQGYVTLALSMRGWPPSGGRDDCGLEQPNDVAKAADWLASMPGVNPDQIGVLGFSQGGQVALLAGARSRRIKAIVAYYPVADIQRWKETTSHSGIRDFYIPQVCGSGVLNSPVNSAGKIEAPALLVHGDRDTRVPTEQSLIMEDALKKAGRRAQVQLIPGAQHGFSKAENERVWPVVVNFFRTNLGKP